MWRAVPGRVDAGGAADGGRVTSAAEVERQREVIQRLADLEQRIIELSALVRKALEAAPATATEVRSPRDLLTTEEASQHLGGYPTVGTLENWRVRGVGPVYRKLGGGVVYMRRDLDEWLDSRSFADKRRRRK